MWIGTRVEDRDISPKNKPYTLPKIGKSREVAPYVNVIGKRTATVSEPPSPNHIVNAGSILTTLNNNISVLLNLKK